MDRALDPQLLADALGTHERLPNPDELGDLLAQAEIDLFFGTETDHDRLLATAWYLHSVAGTRADVIDATRRRQAGQVSAHIFDVFLQGAGLEVTVDELLRFTLAGQYGYLVGDLTPNAIAIATALEEDASLTQSPGRAAMQVGVFLMGLDRRRLRAVLDRLKAEERALAEIWEDLDSSPYGPAVATIEGIRHLATYLFAGDIRQGTDNAPSPLALAAAAFQRALVVPGGTDDTDSRWLAALLADLGEDLAASSVWAVLPPHLGPTARALVLAEPAVLLFWPPQAKFLRSDPSPLDPATRRQVLAFPTSAGKTLVSQVLILSHIQTTPGDVCIVAPTHSLCREIEEALRPRLELLRAGVVDAGPRDATGALPPAGRVAVMTPERFAGLLRSSPTEFLERFSLFVIDEAHLLAERERGWGLEEALTLVHHLTRETAHRVVLVSAAMGTDAHIATWLTTTDPPLIRSDAWRGPRRLYALFNTERDHNAMAYPHQVGKALPRRHIPVRGIIRLRRSATEIAHGSFTDPVGTRVERQNRRGAWVADGGTPQLQQTVPLVSHLVNYRKTPTLVIVATRNDARQLASWVADPMSDVPELAVLADRVRERVGATHALPDLIRKGVAYHHGALPTDVQAEIEDAARAGQIRCLVATATLTEGVNLPFKAVVIASLGYGPPQNFVAIIDPPRLVNALGRAGRACRETEAWLFLVRHGWYETGMFDQLRQEGADLPLRSSLLHDEALAEFAAFEALRAVTLDAVLQDNGRAPNEFCAFVWHLAEMLDAAGHPLGIDGVMSIVEASLAWQQADAATQQQWRNLVAASKTIYDATGPSTRRRFAQSGASLPGALALDTVRASATAAVATAPAEEVAEWLDLLLGDGRLDQILSMPENRLRSFKPYRTAPAANPIDVDILAMLQRWVAGDELEDIGTSFLGEITDPDYRAEALSEFSSSVFEHHLPWALGSLIAWINTDLEQADLYLEVPTSLSSFVHYGVSTPTALRLMTSGIRSRRLAQAVSQALGPDIAELRAQLTAMGLQGWRDEFAAHPAELSDLLTYVRGTPVLADVLDGSTAAVPVTRLTAVESGAAELGLDDAGSEPRPLVVRMEGSVVGHVSSDFYRPMQQLVDLGLPLDTALDHTTATLSVAVRAAGP